MASDYMKKVTRQAGQIELGYSQMHNDLTAISRILDWPLLAMKLEPSCLHFRTMKPSFLSSHYAITMKS